MERAFGGSCQIGDKMATFIYTGEEYINADHIISIDASLGTATVWIRLETGDKYA